MTDTIHGLAALIAVTLLSGGVWHAFGVGWSAIILGMILLCGVIYARTRSVDVREPD